MAIDFEVTDLGAADHPTVGEPAPAFTRPLVTAEYWEDTALSALEPPVVLVFAPMLGSFPATYIYDELADRAWDDQYDVSVVGCTISTPYDIARFLDAEDYPYPLFSDPANGVAERYGVVHDLDGMAGVSEPRPAVFVIDDDRSIRYAWAATEWPAFPPYDAIADALASR